MFQGRKLFIRISGSVAAMAALPVYYYSFPSISLSEARRENEGYFFLSAEAV